MPIINKIGKMHQRIHLSILIFLNLNEIIKIINNEQK